MLLGEVVAPELAPLLLNLLPLVGFLIALGFAVMVSTVVQFMVKVVNRVVGWIPGAGPVISDAASDFGAWFTQGWSQAISGLDNEVGRYFYALSEEWNWIVSEIQAGANVSRIIATVMVGQKALDAVVHGIVAVRNGLHALEHTATVALHKILAIEHAFEHPNAGLLGKAFHIALKPIEGRLRTVERWIGGTGATVYGDLTKVVEPDIASLKERATSLENEAIRVYRDAAGAWHVVNTDALAAAIAIALAGLGLSGLSCNSFTSLLGKRGCGLGSALDDILGLLVDGLILEDLCQVLPLAEEAFSAVEGPLVTLIADAANAVCAQPDSGWGMPAPPALYLPPSPGLAGALP